MIEVGRLYRHYKKGDRYKVLLLCTDTESEEEMVIYQSTTNNKVWARPSRMWEDKIDKSEITEFGQDVRFRLDYLTWCELEDISP